VIFGGIFSSTRQAIKKAAVAKGGKLYIYPEQYEGQECDPLVFCTGPVPAQQVDPLIPWLMQQTGAKKFYLPSADYIWPRVMNKKVREAVTANGGSIVGEDYFPLDHTDYGATISNIMSSGTDIVFNMTVPPGVAPFLEQLYNVGFTRRGGRIVCTYFDENLLSLLPAPMSKVCTAASTTTRPSATRSARDCSPSIARATPARISSPGVVHAPGCIAA
jgi:branched-chain amino acid transport system substrate-binding protein